MLSPVLQVGACVMIILGIVGLVSLVMKRLCLTEDASRQIIHVLVALLVSIAPYILRDMGSLLVLALIFTMLNMIALTTNGVQAMHGVRRLSFGTVFFPISYGILVILFFNRSPSILTMSMLVLGLGSVCASATSMPSVHELDTVYRNGSSSEDTLDIIFTVFGDSDCVFHVNGSLSFPETMTLSADDVLVFPETEESEEEEEEGEEAEAMEVEAVPVETAKPEKAAKRQREPEAEEVKAAPAKREKETKKGKKEKEKKKRDRKPECEITVIAEGQGRVCETGDKVTIGYVGRLETGKEFDRNKRIVINLGSGEMIPGFERGVMGMKQNEVREVIIPPALAYGRFGIRGTIPPNATLMFRIECKRIK
ncbi:peptidyl-prolyl cis-trans isomerase, FKBP-type [Kipferlia bialata]|uniref:peptidylprolyl isomerase n=1 Tax=Kipferlia bialata TaxID=797122 RepID=A0A9K3CTD6_9EUKA|nr:peptidyl-prolyl cis-trans isomerase, FKBP-type [Kipferlia bialata]|eukprot:g3201.t1